MTADLLVNPVFLSFASAVAGGILTLLASLLTKRAEKAPDILTSLNAAVSSAIDHHVRALAQADAEKRQLHHEIAEMHAAIRDLKATVEQQSETIADLEEHIDHLTLAMKKAGVTPPPRPRRKPKDE